MSDAYVDPDRETFRLFKELPLDRPVFLRRSFNLTLALQLPIEPLVELRPGAVSAEEFAVAFLSEAAVIDASLSR